MPLSYARAAIGSRNPAKIEAVRRALARLAPDCARRCYGRICIRASVLVK